ncbi:glycosyltransferase family 4 protein [Azospirillum sp. sgz301742]
MTVFFYPHSVLRDHHFDAMRAWPRGDVANPELAEGRVGHQVAASTAVGGGARRSWKQIVPLINLKRRPAGLPPDVVVYAWGGILATGPFIVELENPYALTGYNLPAVPLWRPVLRRLLLQDRCREIRCMSAACRATLGWLLGDDVAAKAVVHYPTLPLPGRAVDEVSADGPRFLFVSTQFEIKGGPALLRAFRQVRQAIPSAHLDLITHLPPEFEDLARQDGVTVHPARFTRAEIWERFMAQCDVLVHPTFADSYGMVAQEALAHGLAVIATDVYALREMVEPGRNGALLSPPIAMWNGIRPGPLLQRWWMARELVQGIDTTVLEGDLATAMIGLAADPARLLAARRASADLYARRFLNRSAA